MIQAILFDLYETLITESVGTPTRASSLAGALGIEERAYRAEWKKRRPRVVVGDFSFAEALTEICQKLIGTVEAAAVEGICLQRRREKEAVHSHVDAHVATLVSDLSRRGVLLGVVSNGFKEDVVPWPGCKLAPAFACTAFSCHEGVAKPEPEIYFRALSRLGIDHESAVYIGDGGDDELEGAERAGLLAYRASWFVPNSLQTRAWPELSSPQDVLRLVESP